MLTIARWFNNKQCAVSLRFDDNFDSHINFVIPYLNQHQILATFMINPGRNNFIVSYKRHKNFWENQVPQMGHRLGNHTWNHKGARNISEAEFEIGEVSKLLWKLYPQESKLNVFASGGGETWGGRRWHKAAFQYKNLAKKFFLIDLYSSEHKRVELNTHFSRDDWNKLISETLNAKDHRAFVFHKIGSKSIIDLLKEFLTGYNNCFSKIQFVDFISDLQSKSSQIWIAPVIDILKYEKEYSSSRLEVIPSEDNLEIRCKLSVELDPTLYDHKLSLILSKKISRETFKLYQDGKEITISKDNLGYPIANVQPQNSEILIKYY